MGLEPDPERWPSGRRRAPAKGVWVKSPSRVRIPPSPPCICLRFAQCAPVAQLDRAPGYEPGGREFESLRARHMSKKNAGSEPAFLGPSATFVWNSRPTKAVEFDNLAAGQVGRPERSDGGPERKRGMSGRRGREQSLRAHQSIKNSRPRYPAKVPHGMNIRILSLGGSLCIRMSSIMRRCSGEILRYEAEMPHFAACEGNPFDR